MTQWRCLVMSGSGASEWRSLDAPSRDAAVARLVADGFTPLDLRSGSRTLSEILQQPITLSHGLPVTEQALILRQLATLMQSGVPIDRSLDLLREQTSRAVSRRMLAAALTRVRGGGSLAVAFDETKAFPAYVSGVLRAAERSGRLGDALTSLAERLELAATTRRQLVTALSYPAAVLVATVGALLLVLTMVVPQFEPLFEGQEERLPFLTRVVLAMSHIALDHAVMTLGLMAAAVATIIFLVRAGATFRWLDPIRKYVPLLALRDQYLSAQFAGVLGTLILNGLMLVDALPLVRGTLRSARWQSFLRDAERDIRAGHRLSAALARGGLLPSTVVRLIEVGEQGGRVGETSVQAGNIMAEAVRARIDRLVALANPVTIILLGGLVGMLVAGVMLGIFAMGDFAE
jgi:general secretion pathway protein F